MFRHYSRRALRPFVLPTVLTLLGLTYAATAQNASGPFFTNNATISNEVKPEIVLIGYASLSDRDSKAKPTSPTISIVKGGVIAGRLYVYNNSKLSVGGRVINGVYANDKSSVTISGGSVTGIAEAHDKSILTINGGSNVGGVLAMGSSVVNIRGGIFGVAGVAGIETSTINLYGSNLKSTLYITGSNVYEVSGKLADGTAFNSRIAINKAVKIVLHNTPVPSH